MPKQSSFAKKVAMKSVAMKKVKAKRGNQCRQFLFEALKAYEEYEEAIPEEHGSVQEAIQEGWPENAESQEGQKHQVLVGPTGQSYRFEEAFEFQAQLECTTIHDTPAVDAL